MHRLRLGTRASALARWQANWVSAQLAAQGIDVVLVPITTHGDQASSSPLAATGVTGLFTKELQRALLAKEIDLAVHSLKDLPTDDVPGLVLAAVPAREVANDVLISRTRSRLSELPPGATIGTGSLRRRAQLLHERPDLELRDIRGNVDTRLEKLAGGQFDAIVLAQAGLARLGLAAHIAEAFELTSFLPAVGQGALGLETRAADRATRAALAFLDDRSTHQAVLAERLLLATLAGGCLAPIGAYARLQSGVNLRLDAVVLSADGQQRLAAGGDAELAQAERLGENVAKDLLAMGAGALVEAARRQ